LRSANIKLDYSEKPTNLTGDERHSVQLVPPPLRNQNVIMFLIVLISLHALVVSMFDNVLHILLVHSVCDVPEEGTLRQSLVFTWFWQVLPEVVVF
jgi:hypothetical protein